MNIIVTIYSVYSIVIIAINWSDNYNFRITIIHYFYFKKYEPIDTISTLRLQDNFWDIFTY